MEIDDNGYEPSVKKEIDRHDSRSYWPTSIKETIRWFPFISTMENNENILEPNKALIPLLLKVFAMFQLRIFYDKNTRKKMLWRP